MDLTFSNIFSGLIISAAGMAFFMYGKKAQRPWPLVAGIAMCAYPYFITSLLVLWLLTAGLVTSLYFLREQS